MVSAESSSVDLGPLPTPEKDPASTEEDEKKKVTTTLTEVEADLLCNWLTSTLGPQRVRNVKTTVRLSDSPAIVTRFGSPPNFEILACTHFKAAF